MADARVLVHDAAAADAAGIQAIFAHHVLHSAATFETTPPDVRAMEERIQSVTGNGFPYLVAEIDGRVVGFAYAATYRPRPGYRYTVENAVYVADEMARRGIGTALMIELVKRCERGPWRHMLAVIGDSGNAASIALHEKLGFTQAGTLRSIGFKLGRWVDTVLMLRSLGPGDTTPPANEPA